MLILGSTKLKSELEFLVQGNHSMLLLSYIILFPHFWEMFTITMTFILNSGGQRQHPASSQFLH